MSSKSKIKRIWVWGGVRTSLASGAGRGNLSIFEKKRRGGRFRDVRKWNSVKRSSARFLISQQTDGERRPKKKGGLCWEGVKGEKVSNEREEKGHDEFEKKRTSASLSKKTHSI